MSWANSEAIKVLWFLLPGFVASGLFRSLVSNPKPSGFDSVAQVFIFTVIVQATAQLIFSGLQTKNMNLAALSAVEILLMLGIAILSALLAAWIWNKDLLHRFLRRIKVTKQSSYRSAQYSAFAFHSDCYVVLHMNGQRRLFGWPKEWPSRPDDQHFLIEECEWLEGDERKPITGVSHILIPAEEVEMIEFLPMVTETETKE